MKRIVLCKISFIDHLDLFLDGKSREFGGENFGGVFVNFVADFY
jgi:hypothetical protein